MHVVTHLAPKYEKLRTPKNGWPKTAKMRPKDCQWATAATRVRGMFSGLRGS
jgi:hypothetical protein